MATSFPSDPNKNPDASKEFRYHYDYPLGILIPGIMVICFLIWFNFRHPNDWPIIGKIFLLLLIGAYVFVRGLYPLFTHHILYPSNLKLQFAYIHVDIPISSIENVDIYKGSAPLLGIKIRKRILYFMTAKRNLVEIRLKESRPSTFFFNQSFDTVVLNTKNPSVLINAIKKSMEGRNQELRGFKGREIRAVSPIPEADKKVIVDVEKKPLEDIKPKRVVFEEAKVEKPSEKTDLQPRPKLAKKTLVKKGWF